MTEDEVEDILLTFDKLYLVETIRNEDGICNRQYLLHYHYYSYLLNQVDDNEQKEMHQKLVDSYK